MLKRNSMQRYVAFLSVILMINVNVFANILPINNITTGEISDSFFNLFAPTGITFSIWGVIYVLLLIYGLTQLKVNHDLSMRQNLFDDIALPFTITNIANIAWILAWHFGFIALSVVFMVVIFIFLLLIVLEIKRSALYHREDMVVIVYPFHVYFAWICVASIANITTFLVALGFSSAQGNPLLGLNDVMWLLVMLVVGLLVMSGAVLYLKAGAIALVFAWAYLGIYLRIMELPLVTGVDWLPPSALLLVILWMVGYALGLMILVSLQNRRVKQRFR